VTEPSIEAPIAGDVEPETAEAATSDAPAIESSIAALIDGDVEAETAQAATHDAPVAEPSTEAPPRTVSAETLSDPAAFGRDTPERDAWIRRYFESRQALVGESRAEAESCLALAGESRALADEQPRRPIEKKS
jgi:hypothetical protein